GRRGPNSRWSSATNASASAVRISSWRGATGARSSAVVRLETGLVVRVVTLAEVGAGAPGRFRGGDHVGGAALGVGDVVRPAPRRRVSVPVQPAPVAAPRAQQALEQSWHVRT